ncbi:PhnD/SsuA/transferrin family substrate-binding protein [Sulfitobacter sp. HNIBRBA3233]|uniref:phosphate/phosphite/phosphonate ABC transporter substrate-binding protein n=1 Tax=Sulfitobacter marinivivus TaxID=3158558 RepID=UPI0032DEB8D5
MIASLMMYTHPAIDGALQRYWRAIRAGLRRRGIDAPAALAQEGDPFAVWRAPDLVLGQTCGMPYRTRLHDMVHLVGTPDYGLPGCPPGYYQSVIVVRADDPRAQIADFATGTLAYNDALSQSGFAALHAHLGESGFRFARHLRSGAHALSAHLVAEGQADLAALDAQTWRLLARHSPVATQLRVLERTAPTPGLPYICADVVDPRKVADAVEEAIDALDPADRVALDLRGLVQIPASAYLAVPTPPDGVLQPLRRQAM